jgi:hypothetical protein
VNTLTTPAFTTTSGTRTGHYEADGFDKKVTIVKGIVKKEFDA